MRLDLVGFTWILLDSLGVFRIYDIRYTIYALPLKVERLGVKGASGHSTRHLVPYSLEMAMGVARERIAGWEAVMSIGSTFLFD